LGLVCECFELLLLAIKLKEFLYGHKLENQNYI